MTENEKAKAYDDALKKASAAYKDEDKHLKATLERIFPELKEDDDAKIKKDLIQWVDEFPDIIWRGHYKEDIIAWLEKQGDNDKLIQELGEYKVKYTQEVLEKYITSMSNKDNERLRKTTIAFLKDFAEKGYENAVECIDWLEKQGEQSSSQTNEHAWTIQDAKDGDVLVCDIDKTEIGGDVEKLPNIVSTVFIFKKLINIKDYIHSYCHLYDKRFLGLQRTMYYNSFVHNISPATKEQRDLLYQKIEETGYKWNDETNTFEKLEDFEEVGKSSFHEGDWVVRGDSIAQILDVQEQYYVGLDINGKYFVSSRFLNGDKIHLWTIKDAKDGDVLCCKSGWMCIFKSLNNHTNTYSSYCFMDSDKCFFNSGSECHTLDKEFINAYNGLIHPATKEQRDTLMKAMNEAGYEWDTEKKELKKK